MAEGGTNHDSYEGISSTVNDTLKALKQKLVGGNIDRRWVPAGPRALGADGCRWLDGLVVRWMVALDSVAVGDRDR
jgi:hypothetical protein